MRRRLRRYFHPANVVIDLLGLAGVCGAIAYALGLRVPAWRGADPARLENLWSTIATDLIALWVTVRLIEALFKGREDRNRARHHLVDVERNLLRIADDLAPTFYDWRLREFVHLTAWTRGLVHRARRFISAEEYRLVSQALDALERAEQAANACIAARDMVEPLEKAVDKLPHWLWKMSDGTEKNESIWDFRSRGALQEAEDEYRQFLESAPYAGLLTDRVDAARQQVAASGMPQGHADTLNRYLDAMLSALREWRMFADTVEKAAVTVYAADALLLTEHEDSVPLPARRQRALDVQTTLTTSGGHEGITRRN